MSLSVSKQIDIIEKKKRERLKRKDNYLDIWRSALPRGGEGGGKGEEGGRRGRRDEILLIKVNHLMSYECCM